RHNTHTKLVKHTEPLASSPADSLNQCHLLKMRIPCDDGLAVFKSEGADPYVILCNRRAGLF
ncbi:MAG: hypothetical protein ACI8ZW_001194, partial [Yoonia sp.]